MAATSRNVVLANEPSGTDRLRSSGWQIASFIALLLFAVIWIIPFAWAIATSLKPESDTTNIPIEWVASTVTFGAYVDTLTSSSLPRWFFNSVLTSTVITVGTVLLASLAAFGFSRLRFRFRRPLLWITLAGLMVPPQVLIVPQFQEMVALGLVDTYWGIILPQLASAIAVFVLKQAFDGLPRELEEAAVLDGASALRIYWEILMPLIRPSLAAISILTFVWSWNNFLWPFIVITNTQMMTIPVGLATVQSSYGIQYAQIMANAVLGGLPLVIVFLFFQRQIVQGVAGVGIKG